MKQNKNFFLFSLFFIVQTMVSGVERISIESLNDCSSVSIEKPIKAKEFYDLMRSKNYGLIRRVLTESPTLIEKKLKVRAKGTEDEFVICTPLIFAIKHCKDADLVELLLQKGADWKRKIEGKSAFTHAMIVGDPTILSHIHFAMYAKHMYPEAPLHGVVEYMKKEKNAFFCSQYVAFLDRLFYAMQNKYRDKESGHFIYNADTQIILDKYEELFSLTPLEVLLQEEQAHLIALFCDMGKDVNEIGSLKLPLLYLLIHKVACDKEVLDKKNSDSSRVVVEPWWSEARSELRALFDVLISKGAIVDSAILEYAKNKELPIAFYLLLLNVFESQNKEKELREAMFLFRPTKRFCAYDIRES